MDDIPFITHGHHFFRRGGEEFFFMCTWVKNGYRGGDVFGCHSLGEEGGKGGGKKIFNIKENNCLLLNKKMFFQSFGNCFNYSV